MLRRLILVLLLLIGVAGVAFVAYAWRTEIDAVDPPARSTFDPASITRGASLAAIGDCIACHTAPEGRPYAGGFPLRTQFGTIYGSNITPDTDAGIGRWSLAAFTRAMREGVDRQGRHLYPAFPYDHFTILTDEDLKALYAFLMTREPVRQKTPAHAVTFPLNIRMLIAGWKLLYFEPTGFRPDPTQNTEWNRGAYLAQGLGHCGACHTPRNALGAEKRDLNLAGGEVEGWHAPALNPMSPSPVPWSAESLFRYLRYGGDDVHDVAIGPMAPVAHNLGSVPESEVRAIAIYIASVMGPADAERQKRAQQIVARVQSSNDIEPSASDAQRQDRGKKDAAMQNGAAIYAGSCAICHGAPHRAPGSPSSSALHLALSSSLSLPEPGNLIRVVMQGVAPPDGERGPFMPGFYGAFTDEQVAALVSYLRASYTDRPQWTDIAREVRNVRQSYAQARE
jgi:mono/diheme cytochrome c family protein